MMIPIEQRDKEINNISKLCDNCNDCPLKAGRTYAVSGSGPAITNLMVIGEAPGAEEDKCGIPFSGRAGKLLNQMLIEAGTDRGSTYVTNCVSCRPPNNRDPEPEELKACWRYLRNRILIIRPKVIITVGRFATGALVNLPNNFKITKAQGTFYDYEIPEHGYDAKVMPILHTAYLLRGNKQKEISDTAMHIRRAVELSNQ